MRRLLQSARALVPDALAFAGVACVAAGIAMFDVRWGLIALGLMLLGVVGLSASTPAEE